MNTKNNNENDYLSKLKQSVYSDHEDIFKNYNFSAFLLFDNSIVSNELKIKRTVKTVAQKDDNQSISYTFKINITKNDILNNNIGNGFNELKIYATKKDDPNDKILYINKKFDTEYYNRSVNSFVLNYVITLDI